MVVRIQWSSPASLPLPPGDREGLGSFAISVPPADRIPLRHLGASGTLLGFLPNSFGGDKELARQWLGEVGLRRLVAQIEAGNPLEELPPVEVLLTDHVEDEPIQREKRCGYQSEGSTGLMCGVSARDDQLGGKTSRPLCEACTLPSDEVRCSALIHPEVRGFEDSGGVWRRPVGAICDAGHQDRVGDTRDCRFGGNDCWRRDVIIGSAVAGPPPRDAAERLIDEFSYTRISLEGALGQRFTRGSGEMALATTLMRVCDTESEFVAHLAALAALLTLLDGRKRAEELGVPEDERTGPLNGLEACLRELGIVGLDASFDTMRAVARLRQMAPVHPKMDAKTIAEFSRFGVALPVSDWADAWRRVAEACRISLRHLRLVIEAGANSAP